MTPSTNMSSPYYVYSSIASMDFFDSNLGIGSYIGEIVMGQMITDPTTNAKIFDEGRSFSVKSHLYPLLIQSLKKAKKAYTSSNYEPFSMDIRDPSKKEPLNKLVAFFEKMDDDSTADFSLRERWNYRNDTRHLKR